MRSGSWIISLRPESVAASGEVGVISLKELEHKIEKILIPVVTEC